MKSYDELWDRRESLYQAKSKILRYTPGSWLSDAGGKKRINYVIPKTTTLLLIGPKGSGKSSLINRISRVFEDDKFATERAQVTYIPSSGEGTYFLQEYMVPRGSTSFCLFDSRSLSETFADNDELLRQWMMKGVRHGELVIRECDSSGLKTALKCKARQSGSPSSEIRKVNFVIFVVNGFSVLRSMNSDKKEDRKYMDMAMDTFSCPYLSFKDDKPVVVVTHGDLLSLRDRARVRIHLGEKLGVPPTKQIFDLPDNRDPFTELVILDMIRYSLEHADKILPYRESREWVDSSLLSMDGVKDKVSGTSIFTFVMFAILLGVACIAFPILQSHKRSKPLLTSPVNWHSKSEVHQPYVPHEPPLMTPPSEPQTKSPANHSRENRGHDNEEPQVKPSPALPSKPFRESQRHENQEPRVKPAPTLPSKPVVATSAQALPSKSAAGCHHKRRESESSESRSPSPDSRHPKSAVKWHKIRHLWLDSD